MLTEAIDYGTAGGFGSYLLALNKRTYEQAGVDTDGNTPGSYKEPGIGWMTCFLFVTSFVGLLALVPLRKVDFSESVFGIFLARNETGLFMFLGSYADYDNRLQTNLSKWNCYCCSHKWIPHSSWRQDG